MTDLVVAIVGTGIGGTEMAGYLGLHGTRVRVHDIRKEAVDGIRDRGGLEVSGIESGFAPVERATTDLAEAVEGATLIAVTTVNNDHQAVARQLAPRLRDGQVVALIPGYVGGSFEFRRALAAAGCRAAIKLGEMDNFPFTGAVLGPAAVRVASVKRQLQVAALPAADGAAVLDLVKRVLPPATLARNVLQTALATMNPILHVPGMLGNQGRIDAGERRALPDGGRAVRPGADRRAGPAALLLASNAGVLIALAILLANSMVDLYATAESYVPQARVGT